MTYVINDPEVLQFLHQHPDLLLVLAEAIPRLDRLFDPVSVVLKMRDKLWGYIQTSLSVDEAVDRLDGFDETWFLSRMPGIVHLLDFNLEFVE